MESATLDSDHTHILLVRENKKNLSWHMRLVIIGKGNSLKSTIIKVLNHLKAVISYCHLNFYKFNNNKQLYDCIIIINNINNYYYIINNFLGLRVLQIFKTASFSNHLQ